MIVLARLLTRGKSPAALRTGTRLKGDGGAATVEFALTLPFLATLVLGISDGGRGWQMKSRVTSAAREGAAWAQYQPGYVYGCTGSNSIATVALAEGTLPSSATVVVKNLDTGVTYAAACVATAAAGQRVSVTVTAPMLLTSPGLSSLYGTNLQISGYAEVVVQG